MLTFVSISNGQNQFRDPTFGINGVSIFDVGQQYDGAQAIVIQSDNKIVLAGKMTLETYDYQYLVIRYDEDGTVDESFGENGICAIDAGLEESYNKLCLSINEDDEIYFAGQTEDLNCIILAKINTDGILVESFGTNGVASLCGSALITNNIILQPDGKIVLTGFFANDEQYKFGMTRFNSDGSLDTDFGVNGIVESYFGPEDDLTVSSQCYCSDICSNGKIILAGTTVDTSHVYSLTVARYNTDGSLDNSFALNGVKLFTLGNAQFWDLYNLKIDENDNLIYSGHTGNENSFEFVGRLNSNGEIDLSFNNIGYIQIANCGVFGKQFLKLQSNGKILIRQGNSLSNATFDYLIARINPNGSFDNSFGFQGIIYVTDEIEFHCEDFAIQNDGKIVTAGTSRIDYNYSFAMFRFLDDKNINGFVFYDENSNEIYEENEVGLPHQIVKIEPGPYYVSTNNVGSYFYSNYPQTYTVSFIPLEYWESTSEDASYQITLENENDIFNNINFGVVPKLNISDLSSSLTGTATRSGFDTYMWLSYENRGTTTQSGTVSLEYDPAYTFIGTDHIPSSHNGNLLEWEYSSLPSQGSENILIQLRVPGVEFLDETLISISKITPTTGDTIPTNNTDTISQIVTGSYDPNDKLVTPRGIGDEGLVLHNTQLTYTVRFQNTGSDTAFNIVVIDTLDVDLNIETFRFISSSHPCTYDIYGRPDENTIITFSFNNIQLPHDDVNELGSNGFLKFSILPKEDISDYTTVNNLAYIYFDYNPPIITNEVTNTFVSIISNVQSNRLLNQIYPNPTTGILTIKSDEIYNVEIYSIDGKLIQTFGKNSEIDLSKFQNGIYIISIETQSQRFIEKVIKQ